MYDRNELRNRAILKRVKNKNVIICYNDKDEILIVNSIFEVPHGYEIKRKPFSKESKEKMKESAIKRCKEKIPETFYRDKSGENNPMYGKTQSLETKEKISKSLKENNKLKGKHLYHNIKTHQNKYFLDNEVPEGWIKGKYEEN